MKPSPWRRASAIAARQSARTPSSLGRIGNVWPEATNTTGFSASTAALRSSSALASWASSPPTPTPSIRTPSAIFAAEPAKTKPRTTPAATRASATARSRRRTAGMVAPVLEDEQLDAARDVELDTGDVRREVGAEERDRIRNVLGVA